MYTEWILYTCFICLWMWGVLLAVLPVSLPPLPRSAGPGKRALAAGKNRVQLLWQGGKKKREQHRMSMEIYEGISFLRNLTVLGRGSRLSADGVLEELGQLGGLLQPVYGRTLQLLRMDRRNEAQTYFTRTVGTPIAEDYARLLLQWDRIDPKDLLETLLSHQKALKEIRSTEQKRRNETISDVIYLPVVLNVMLVFLNFIYIAYFIDQKEMLSIFF